MSPSFLPVLFSVLAGAVIWAVHFTVIYGLTSVACARGLDARVVPLTVVVATGVAALAAGAVMVRALRPVAPAGNEAPADFIRWITAAVAGLALAAILLEAVTVAFVPACA